MRGRVVVAGMLLMVGRIILEYILIDTINNIIGDAVEIVFSLSLRLALKTLVRFSSSIMRWGYYTLLGFDLI